MPGLERNEARPSLDPIILFDAFASALRDADFSADHEGRVLSVDAGRIVADFARRVDTRELFSGAAGSGYALVSAFPSDRKTKAALDEAVRTAALKIAESGWKGCDDIPSFQDPRMRAKGFLLDASSVASEKEKGKERKSTLIGAKFAASAERTPCAYTMLAAVSIRKIDGETLLREILEEVKSRLTGDGCSEESAADLVKQIRTTESFRADFETLSQLVEEKSVGKLKMHAAARQMRMLIDWTSAPETEREMLLSAKKFYESKKSLAKGQGSLPPLNEEALRETLADGQAICSRLGGRMKRFLDIVGETSDDPEGNPFRIRLANENDFVEIYDMDADSALFDALPIVFQYAPSLEEASSPGENSFVFPVKMKKNGPVQREGGDPAALYHLKKMARRFLRLAAAPGERIERNQARPLVKNLMVYFHSLYKIAEDIPSKEMRGPLAEMCAFLNEDHSPKTFVPRAILTLCRIADPAFADRDRVRRIVAGAEACGHDEEALSEKERKLDELLAKLYARGSLQNALSNLGVFVDATENIALPDRSRYILHLSIASAILSDDTSGYATGKVFERGRVAGQENWYRYIVVTESERLSDTLYGVECGVDFKRIYSLPSDGARCDVRQRNNMRGVGMLPVVVAAAGERSLRNKGRIFAGNFLLLHNTLEALSPLRSQSAGRRNPNGASLAALGLDILAQTLCFALAKIVREHPERPEFCTFIPLFRVHSSPKEGDDPAEEMTRLVCVQAAHTLSSVPYGKGRFFLSCTQGYNVDGTAIDFASLEPDTYRQRNAMSSMFALLPKIFTFPRGSFSALAGKDIALLAVSSRKCDSFRRDKEEDDATSKSAVFGKVFRIQVLDDSRCRWSLFRTFQATEPTAALYSEPLRIEEEIAVGLGRLGVAALVHISKAPFRERLALAESDDGKKRFASPRAVESIIRHHALERAKKAPGQGDGEALSVYPCHCMEFSSAMNPDYDGKGASFIYDDTLNQTSRILGNDSEGRRNQAFFSITPNISLPSYTRWECEALRMPKRTARNTSTYIAACDCEPGKSASFAELTSDEGKNRLKREMTLLLSANHLADWGKFGETVHPKKNPYSDIFEGDESLCDKAQYLAFRRGGFLLQLNLIGFNTRFAEIVMPKRERFPERPAEPATDE